MPGKPKKRPKGEANSDTRPQPRPGRNDTKGTPPYMDSHGRVSANATNTSFRELIYSMLTMSVLMLATRERLGALVGVSGPQFVMLVAIEDLKTATVVQIATRLHVSLSFVTAETGKLIRQGIVRKSPNTADKRSVLLSLTTKGKRLVEQLIPHLRIVNDTVFRSFDRQDMEQFSEMLATVNLGFENALHALNSPEFEATLRSALTQRETRSESFHAER